MGRLLSRGQQLSLVEEIGGVVDDGVVGAVVGTQQDLAGMVVRVVVVEALQQGDVEPPILGEGAVDLRTDLDVQQINTAVMIRNSLLSFPEKFLIKAILTA